MKTLLPEIDSADKRFHNGNPATGEQGTRVTDTWLNDVQDRVRDVQAEAHYVLQKAGFKPIPNKTTQLYEAIIKIISDNRNTASTTKSGEVQLSSAIDSNDEDKAATPKAVKTVKDQLDSVQRNQANYIPNSKKSNAVNSNSADDVATSVAVKTAFDKGVEAKNTADGANKNANGRVSKSGDSMTGTLTVPHIVVNDPSNNNNSVQIGDDAKFLDVDIGDTIGLQSTNAPARGYIAYGTNKKRFGYDGSNFISEAAIYSHSGFTSTANYNAFCIAAQGYNLRMELENGRFKFWNNQPSTGQTYQNFLPRRNGELLVDSDISHSIDGNNKSRVVSEFALGEVNKTSIKDVRLGSLVSKGVSKAEDWKSYGNGYVIKGIKINSTRDYGYNYFYLRPIQKFINGQWVTVVNA